MIGYIGITHCSECMRPLNDNEYITCEDCEKKINKEEKNYEI